MGLTETLEAEVRSKFQTERRMRDAARGITVEVPFDNALVKYLWTSERELRIEDISLSAPSKVVDDVAEADSELHEIADTN